jgi:hypothetical protein
MTTVCGTGGDIRFCGQKQTLMFYDTLIHRTKYQHLIIDFKVLNEIVKMTTF